MYKSGTTVSMGQELYQYSDSQAVSNSQDSSDSREWQNDTAALASQRLFQSAQLDINQFENPFRVQNNPAISFSNDSAASVQSLKLFSDPKTIEFNSPFPAYKTVDNTQQNERVNPDAELKPSEREEDEAWKKIPRLKMYSTTPRSRDAELFTTKHAANLERAARGDVDLVFYGDSITQALSAGGALEKHFGPGVANMGIGSDSTQHLLWRLQAGEANFKGEAPKQAVILIGTNNIFPKVAANDRVVAQGVQAVVDEATKRMPDTQFLVLGILPRGSSPDNPLRERIVRINHQIERMMKGRPNVTYVDIGSELLEKDGSFKKGLWSDSVHLTSKDGNQTLIRAIDRELKKIKPQFVS